MYLLGASLFSSIIRIFFPILVWLVMMRGMRAMMVWSSFRSSSNPKRSWSKGIVFDWSEWWSNMFLEHLFAFVPKMIEQF